MMVVTNAPILTQIRALCGRKLLRRAQHLSLCEHQATPATSIIINTGLCVLFHLKLELRTIQAHFFNTTPVFMGTWTAKYQSCREQADTSKDITEKQKQVQAVGRMMSWSLRHVRESPSQRMRRFSRLLPQPREIEDTILDHTFISWKSETIFQKEKDREFTITLMIEDGRNKHKIRSICAIFLVPRSDDTKDAQVPTSLRKRGRWHPGVITEIRMPSQESWEPLGVQTSFFAIEYLLSRRVVDVATLCFICSITLSQIGGKCQSFLIDSFRDTETFKSWMNYIRPKWAQKHLLNSLRTSHVPHCQSWDEQ